jgi:hypothetical protein
VSADEIRLQLKKATELAQTNPEDQGAVFKMGLLQYQNQKFVRGDNTPENATYLGYVDGRKLYPDFEWIGWAQFVDELIAGNVKKPYEHWGSLNELLGG